MQKLNRSLIVLSSAAAMAIGSELARAQERVEPATQPTTMPTTMPTTHPNGRAPAGKINMNFKDALIDSVLDHLSEAAGFIVLRDKDVKVDGRITVMSRQPVTPEEAVALLNSVLKSSNYTAIQMGRVLKVTLITTAKKSSIPVRYGSVPEDIKQTDELITQVIPLTSVDAVKLKTDLTPLIGTDADLTSNASSNAIIITDTSANIRRVVEIVHNLDKRDAMENSIRVKQLKYADASAAAKLITDIFKTEPAANQQGQQQGGGGPGAFFRALQQQQGGGGGGGGGGGRGAGGGGGASADTGQTRAGRVTASADTRTNTIVVTGPDDTLKVIDTVLSQLDANPASESTFFHYNLKNGQAARIAATLNSLFGSGTGVSGAAVVGRQVGMVGSAARAGTGTQARTGTGTGAFGGTGTFGTGTFGQQGAVARTGFGQAAVGGAVIGTTGGSAAMGELYGQVYVVPDVDTNSLLVATATRYHDQVRDVIEELDRAVPQVLIKVLVAEVSHDNTDDFGVDFSILNTRNGGTFGQVGGTDFGLTDATGGLKVSILEPHVTATLRLLTRQGKLDVLSRPYILASDNQLATITVGQEVPRVTSSRITDSGPFNTIDYADVGIILNVTPHINPDGLVILDVAPEISALTGTTVTVQEGVDAPIIAKRSANSRVGIPNGQTIVIGGMMEDRKTSTVRKVPLLGDVPVLGFLFKRTEITKSKTELLIFLTPHVAAQPAKLRPMSQDEMKGIKLTPNAVQPGTFKDHMEGLQRGKTSTEPESDLTIPEVQPPPKKGVLETPLPGTK